MFLRFLLYILKPTNEQLKVKLPNGFLSFKIAAYRFFLRRLLKTYLHYAQSDTVVVDKGRVKVVHQYRDEAFESELRRNKIDFELKMSAWSLPLSVRKSDGKWCLGFFKFKDRLSVYVDGKELHIRHDDCFSIDGTTPVKVKGCLGRSFMCKSQVEFVSTPLIKETPADSEPDEPRDASRKTPARKPKPKKPNKSSRSLFDHEPEIVPIGVRTDAGSKESGKSEEVPESQSPSKKQDFQEATEQQNPPKKQESKRRRESQNLLQKEEAEKPQESQTPQETTDVQGVDEGQSKIERKGFDIDTSF